MNDLHFYFTTARARYCFYYFIVNANKQTKKKHSQHLTRNKSKNLSNKEMQESVVVGSVYGVSLILLC